MVLTELYYGLNRAVLMSNTSCIKVLTELYSGLPELYTAQLHTHKPE
jgi:hypothetical protein